MARLVKHEAKRPIIIQVSDKPVAICMCGLSKNKPYCDGAHHETANEEEACVYRYNENGTRTEIKE